MAHFMFLTNITFQTIKKGHTFQNKNKKGALPLKNAPPTSLKHILILHHQLLRHQPIPINRYRYMVNAAAIIR